MDLTYPMFVNSNHCVSLCKRGALHPAHVYKNPHKLESNFPLLYIKFVSSPVFFMSNTNQFLLFCGLVFSHWHSSFTFCPCSCTCPWFFIPHSCTFLSHLFLSLYLHLSIRFFFFMCFLIFYIFYSLKLGIIPCNQNTSHLSLCISCPSVVVVVVLLTDYINPIKNGKRFSLCYKMCLIENLSVHFSSVAQIYDAV